LNSEYKNKNEKLMKDLKSFRNDNKKLYDHNKQINLCYNNKLSLHEKEILYLKNLILKISSIINNNNIKNYIDQILEANTAISVCEIERLKIEKNFEKYENELKAFIDKDSKNLENSDLISELKLKVSNAKSKVLEINRKIQDKKQEILVLESKINKEKEIAINLENKKRNNSNGSNKKDQLKNPFLDKYSNKQNANLTSNENQENDENKRKAKANKILFEKRLEQKLPQKNTQTYSIESEEDEKIKENNFSNSNEFEKENSFEQYEIDNNCNSNNFANEDYTHCLKIENNTVNEFFNNNKATNVFKKNYVDSNSKNTIEKDPSEKNNKEKSSIESTIKEDFQKEFININKLNYNYKLNSETKEEEIDQNIADDQEEILNLSEEKEFSAEKFFYNRKSNSKSKKIEGISIDTDKINEKYDKLLNKIVKEETKENGKHETNSLLIDRNIENKLTDNPIPFSNMKSESTNPNKAKIEKTNETHIVLNTNENKHSLNFKYELDEKIKIKRIIDEKIKVNNYKDNNFDYKRNLNSERNKRENKKTLKNILSDDIDKFGKSPEKINSKNNQASQVKKDQDNPVSNKDNYGCNNTFTFNNDNEETVNSIESKVSKMSSKNINENISKNDRRELTGEEENLSNNEVAVINLPKKRGFGKRNFDIDISYN